MTRSFLNSIRAMLAAGALLSVFALGSYGQAEALNNLSKPEALQAVGGWGQPHMLMLVALGAIGGLVTSIYLSSKQMRELVKETMQPYGDLTKAMGALQSEVNQLTQRMDKLLDRMASKP